MLRSCLWLTFLLLALRPAGGAYSANSIKELETVRVPTPAYQRNLEVRQEAVRLLEAGDRDGLEQLAAKLRASRESMDGGTWLLACFYDALDNLPEEAGPAEERMAFFEKWAKERPQNITAQVCLANAYSAYAWMARGSGWANSVTKEGWRLFKERLDKAWQVLQDARGLEEKCPGWYQAAQRVALGQGWERDEYMKMVNEALQKEPTYGSYITNACYWLLPRWYGEQGEFEQWLDQLAQAQPEDKRDRSYARSVWMADRMWVSGEIVFGPGRLDWERTRSGFKTWLEDSSGNLMVRLEFLRLALLANDRETAREQFEIMGPQYFPVMWDNVQCFKQAWNFAFNGSPNPLHSSSRSRTAKLLDPAEVNMMNTVVPIAIKTLGGILAGIILLVLAIQRSSVLAGISAFFASIVLAALLGTVATVLPAAVLWLYLRHGPPPIESGEPRPFSGWLTLLGVIAVICVYLALQFGAAFCIAIPAVIANPGLRGPALLQSMMADGALFRIVLSAAWLSLLLLVAICGRQTRLGWQRRLGLAPQPILQGLLYALAAVVVVFLVGWVLDKFMDARSRESLQYLSAGRQTPVVWLLSMVLVSPLLEELVYRGYACSGWFDKIGVAGTILVTSILFALSHVQYGWVGLVYVFILGLILGLLRWRTGSIYAGLLVHAVTNLGYCLSVAAQ